MAQSGQSSPRLSCGARFESTAGVYADDAAIFAGVQLSDTPIVIEFRVRSRMHPNANKILIYILLGSRLMTA